MRIRTKLTSSIAVAGALALGVAGISPANAAVGCPTGWTEPVAGICQVIVATTSSVTIPSGAGVVSAVLIGGGGGGAATTSASAAGGGSGEVLYVPSVDYSVTGIVSAIAGAGGTASGISASVIAFPGVVTSLQDDSTIHASLGGEGGAVGQGSFNQGGNNTLFTGFNPAVGSRAGGAGSTGSSTASQGGPGYMSFATIAGIDTTIWPATTQSDSSVFDVSYGFARGGWGYAIAPFGGTAYGSGGLGWDNSVLAPTDGRSGAVIIRFAAFEQGGSSTDTSAALANTGAEVTTWGVFAAVSVLAGAAALGIRRKVRNADA